MNRILYVDPAPFAGGAQQSLRTLVRALDPARSQPFVAGPPLLRDFVPPGRWTPLHLPPGRHALRSVPGVARFMTASLFCGIRLLVAVRRIRPALIHANGRGAWLPSLLAARLARIPLVWHARDLVGPRFYDLLAASLADLCIVPSDAMAERLLPPLPGSIGFPAFLSPHLCVIPNGVDGKRFRPGDLHAARVALGLPLDRHITGMIGQWVGWKRVDVFLQAARMAAREEDGLWFVLCGGPPPGEGTGLREEYQAALSGRGTVLEWTEDVPELMAALDALAQPAEAEAFGRTAVEAMSCGIPVLAARAGGLAETVADGLTGFLLPPGDVPALAAAMVALARDPARARQMGEEGRRRVEDRYSAASHAEQVQQQYALLLSRQ